MKKILFTTLVASSALLIFAKTANAEEVGKDQTDVGISFETDGPTKPGQGPFKDNLAMVYTPTKLDFGKHSAVANIATYNNVVEGKQYLVVNDDRQGTVNSEEEGEAATSQTSAWKVSVGFSKLVSKDESATELPAKLAFTLGDPESYTIGNKIDEDTNDYIPNPIEGNLGQLPDAHNIVTGKAVTLEAGNTTAQMILGKTKEDAVKGGFATEIKDTKLTVTSGKDAVGKSFKGTLTWSLDNTYTN